MFPSRTNFSPDDEYCFFDTPPIILPEHNEVHICCIFTWDKFKAEYLRGCWQEKTRKPVKLSGPAYNNSDGDFVAGMYIKQGVVFTSRGCPNNCPWCFVPKREGEIRELNICTGNIINDNNFLACSKRHKNKVFEMLKTQRQINFRGGLECALVDDHFIEAVRGLRIQELWLACDTDGALSALKKTADKLQKAGFNKNKLRCYTMIGVNGIDNDEARLRAVYEAGCMPHAQLYQPEQPIEYSLEYKAFARQWSRPAAMRAHMKRGTDFRTVNKKTEIEGTLFLSSQ